jgi:amidase
LSDDTAITALDALALSAAVKSRQLSCVEVMDAFLDRIELLNPSVNAIVSLQPRDLLRKQAQQRDASWHGESRAVRSTVFQRQSRTSN